MRFVGFTIAKSDRQTKRYCFVFENPSHVLNVRTRWRRIRFANVSGYVYTVSGKTALLSLSVIITDNRNTSDGTPRSRPHFRFFSTCAAAVAIADVPYTFIVFPCASLARETMSLWSGPLGLKETCFCFCLFFFGRRSRQRFFFAKFDS